MCFVECVSVYCVRAVQTAMHGCGRVRAEVYTEPINKHTRRRVRVRALDMLMMRVGVCVCVCRGQVRLMQPLIDRD